MCKKCESIDAVSKAAERLIEACKVMVVPQEQLATELTKAFHIDPTIPEDMRAMLRRIR